MGGLPLRRLEITVFFAAVAALVTISVPPVAGKIEGTLFPVVREVSIATAEPDGELHVLATGSFFKERGRCSFERVEWRAGTPQLSAFAPLEFIETTKVRDEGWEDWGPWRIQLTPSQISNSFAYVYHQCPARPWLTRTIFWTNGQELGD